MGNYFKFCKINSEEEVYSQVQDWLHFFKSRLQLNLKKLFSRPDQTRLTSIIT